MSLREKAIKGVVWSAVQNWGSNVISMVVVLVLANLLGPEPFGRVAYAAVFVAFLTIFQGQGFAQALVQRKNIEPGHLNTAFWISVVAGLLLAAGLVLVAALIALVVQKPWLTPILQALSLTLLIDSIANTPQAILRRHLAFKSLAVRRLAASVAGGIVGIGMALHGYGVWSLVGQRLTASLSGTVALWFASRWRPGLEVSMRHLRELLGFGVFMMGSQTLQVINRQTGPLLIGTFLGDAALGYFRMGYQLLLTMTQLFTQTVSAVALPTFSRLQHDRSQMRSAFLTATRMTSLMAFPAFLGAAVLAPEIVYGLMGDRWAPSIPVMQIMAFLGIIQSLTFFNGPVILACGKPSWSFALNLLNTVANVVVFAVTVRWGIVVVSAAFVVRAYVLLPVAISVARTLIRLDLTAYLRQFVPSLLCSLIMVAVVWAVKQLSGGALSLPGVLAVSILVGVVVYAAAMRVLSPGLFREALDLVRSATRLGTGTAG